MPVFRKDGTSVLYIHVPKAGGSTITRIFADSGYTAHYRDWRTGRQTMNYLRRCSPQHMHRTMLEQIFHLDRFDAIFMTVREPVARLRSEYAMRQQTKIAADAADVDAWFDAAFARYAEDPFVYDNHLRPQAEFHVPGAAVYRVEDGFDRAIKDLNARWGLNLVEEVPKMMDRAAISGMPSSEVRISTELAARLRERYREDVELFGYGE